MDSLSTDRLTLRPWEPEDRDFVFDLYSRWEVQRFIGVVPRVMEDPADADLRIARWRELDDPPLGVYAVGLGVDGPLIGTILLKSIPASGPQPLPSGDIEIGWHFHPDAWGRGYATEAAAAVLARAIAAGLPRVVAVTHPLNSASQAVCRRIGMVHAGLTTAYYNTTCELFVATGRAHPPK
ncbi:MAG TPA: GNAT family N-acetyltransferase [Lacisediminihabitans sp.]|uniref:GNAT family N-acetyltransferase n=1 Tax=Lacisediminihabitans sp. TaxID=2787631 RepID=UPI002ED82AEF